MDKGHLCIIAAAVLWGTTGTTQAFAPHGAQPLAIGTLRLIVGGMILLSIFLIHRITSPTLIHEKMSFSPLLMASACIAAYQLLFFEGVARTGVAAGTIVGIGSSPILAGVLGWLVRGERLSRRWGLATVLSVCGCSLLIVAGKQINIDPLGIILAVGAGGAYATFSLASKNLLESHSVEQVMAVTFGLGALLLAPLLLTQDLSWLQRPNGVAIVLWLGVMATALAYTLFGKGLHVTPLATAVSLSLAEPLTAGTLGLLVLSENLTPIAGLGIAMVFSGLAVLSFRCH